MNKIISVVLLITILFSSVTYAGLIKQSSSAKNIMFFMADSSDHISGKTGITPTVTISKNGAAFASASGAVTEVGNGWYKLAGNATDSDTLGDLILHATGTGADTTDLYAGDVVANIESDTYALVDTEVAAILDDTGTTGVLVSDGSGAGQINLTSGAIDTVASITAAVTVGSINTDAITATAIADGAITGAKIAAGAITSSQAPNLDAAISTRLATAGYTAPNNATITTIQSDTDNIQTRLPAALVSGRIDSSVGAIASNAITATSIATGAIGLAETAEYSFTVVSSADCTNSATIFDTNLTQTQTDHWKDSFITFVTGTLAGQTKAVTAYNGTTKCITVKSPGFSTTPTAGDQGGIINK